MTHKTRIKVSILAIFIVFAVLAFSPHGSNAMPLEDAASQTPAAASKGKDCSAPADELPKGSSRVYIALRGGKDGNGTSFLNARDGSTAESFDRLLRCYSEGCAGDGKGQKPVAKTENLIVCLGPGTFSTLGSYDYIVGVPHSNPQGFTIGKGWKIHGSGQNNTTVKLAAYLPNTAASNPRNFPVNTATGLVFSTNVDGASHVEISDLTIDANYPELKARARQSGITALTLEAIHLRSDQGGHWVHNLNIVNTAGEIGGIDIKWEAFPLWIVSIGNSSPTQNSGNVIENVTMSQSFGETGCAIAVANAVVEVRNNQVNGYPIGYGGWKMEQVYFHDNAAIETEYGFNIDSLANSAVRIEKNLIVHPRKYGIVVGGDAAFTNFKIAGNTLQINASGVIGLLFRGNVTGSVVSGNTFAAENRQAAKSVAIRSSSLRGNNGASRNNTYQSNQIAAGMKTVFEPEGMKQQNCFFQNHDERQRPRGDLADSRNGPCAP